MALQQGLGILSERRIEPGPRDPADFIPAGKVVKSGQTDPFPATAGRSANLNDAHRRGI